MSSASEMSSGETEQMAANGGAETAVTGVGLAMALAAVALASFSLAGCDPESCDQIRKNYRQALGSEPGLAEVTDDGPPHAAVSVDLNRLNDWTSSLIAAAVGDALDVGGTFNVQGQSIDFSVGAAGADLQFEASDACGACLRVFGDIDGDASITLPFVGAQSVPLNGSMDWTVPLDVGLDDGEAAVFFDTEQAVRMSTPRVQASLDGLPGDWTSPVTTALVDELSDSIATEVDPIRLFGYEMPDLGLGGFEMAPSMLAMDSATNTLTLGLRTNLPVEPSRQLEDEIGDVMALDGNSSAAIAIHPRVAVEGVRLAMRAGDVPRRYTLTGNADDDGDAYALVDDFTADAHGDHRDALQLGLNFRAFNFRSWLACFSMRGETTSRLAVDGGRLEFELEDVNISGGGGLIEQANWGAADFVDFSQLMISRSLDDDTISIPGTDVDLLPSGLSTGAGMVIMRTTGE